MAGPILEIWIALGTLTALEIVLGIDNIIFISVLVGRLPEKQRDLARKLGLALAMIARLGPVVFHFLGDGTHPSLDHGPRTGDFRTGFHPDWGRAIPHGESDA